jgi:hypothetical protein
MIELGGREQITVTGVQRYGWHDLPASWFVVPEDEPPATIIGLPVGFSEG